MKTTIRNHWDYYPNVIYEEVDTDDFILKWNQRGFEYCEKYFWECIEKKEPYCYGRNIYYNPEWDKVAWKPPQKFLEDYTTCIDINGYYMRGSLSINVYEIFGKHGFPLGYKNT